MKISFLGAAKTVTGSCFLVETHETKFLVDCGMFQGRTKENEFNDETLPFNPSELDYILLTHAHIDHSGRIPKAYIDGFKGRIIATKATVELCGLMLPDSGHIQEMENEWQNRKRLRAGKPPVKPLYTSQDAIDCLTLFESVSYGEVQKLNENIRYRFNDAGHMLGSSILELWITENGEESKVVFSGDLGNKDIPILRDPTIIESADYLIIESTYGDRLHKENRSKVERFLDIIEETVKKGGNVVIPSFAVGRTQEIIYELNKYMEHNSQRIQSIFNIPVYVDSPLAVSATEVFRKNLDCFDEEARKYIENGDNPLEFPSLKFTKSADESRMLNDKKENMIIISASGMCEAGRIKHHLKHNLWRKESTILFVGYQAVGTLGRRIVDGAKRVNIFGEEITVNARIEMIDGFSGHADQHGLLEWIGRFRRKPRKIFLVHGEEEVMQVFSKEIETRFGIETAIPEKGSAYLLNAHRAVEYLEKPELGFKYKRLAVIEQMELLKEEFEELSAILKSDLHKATEDFEVDEISNKLKNVEKMLLEVLK